MTEIKIEPYDYNQTNALGHELAKPWAEDRGKYGGVTLGAYRRGKGINKCWVPGAKIQVWTACARQETITGMPWPHAFFIQTIGGEDGGSIHCPTCRAEIMSAKAANQPTKGQLCLF